jgi:SAM-dependent methyltransferase
MPDYQVKGTLIRAAGDNVEFDHTSSYRRQSFRANPFYEKLFPEGNGVTPNSPRIASWDAKQVARWREIYDELYKGPSPDPDPLFNTTGWNSSYTGEPLPAKEMREQVEATVLRIRALRPTRVLEIGCGTGLLLFRLAGECVRYCATDVSPTALACVREQLDGLPQVELREAEADDFSFVEKGAFDMVVLNSVVQYFPGSEYLERVLHGGVCSWETFGVSDCWKRFTLR